MRARVVAVCLVAACGDPVAKPEPAAIGTPRWAASFGANGNDDGSIVAIDSLGDVIAAGDLNGLVVPIDMTPVDIGPPGAFITKHAAASGMQVWTLQLSGADTSSNVYIADL